MNRKWTSEEIENLKQWFEEGITDQEIAARLGRTKDSVGIKRVKLGITDIHKRRFTKEGKQRMIDNRKERTKEKSSSWKGGRRVSANGYIELHMPEHHRARGNGYVFEHIVIAETKIGRRLQCGEEVHHINKNKKDNHPDNLEILSKEEHSALHGAEREKRGWMVKCCVCGREVYRKPSHAKKSKCCSLKCVGKYTNLKKKGEMKIC